MCCVDAKSLRQGAVVPFKPAVHCAWWVTLRLKQSKCPGQGLVCLAMDRSGYDSVEEGEVLSMVDIRNKWLEVGADVFWAMFCLLPGIGIFSWIYLFHKYCCSRPQPQGETLFGKFAKVDRALVWSPALLNPLLGMYIVWIHCQAFHRNTLDLKSILGFWELALLTNAIWMGSTFGWLILRRHRDEIVQSVCAHKKQNKEILMANARARDLLDKLFHLFPQQFNEDIYKTASMEYCSLPGFALLASTSFMLLLMYGILRSIAFNYMELFCAWLKRLQEDDHERECKDFAAVWVIANARLGGFSAFSVHTILLFFVYSSGVTLYSATLNWCFFIRNVLTTTSVNMQENCRQLLLFTALTRSEEWNSRWSKQNREVLRKIVDGSLDGETTSASCRSLARSFEMYEDEEDGLKKGFDRPLNMIKSQRNMS